MGKFDLRSALFSLCLPGLGQLYQRRLIESFLFFSVFVVLCFFRVTALLIPWSILSSVETRRGQGTVDSVRVFLFSGVAIVAFIGWFFSFVPGLLPVGTQIEVEDLALSLGKKVQQCVKEKGAGFKDLADCGVTETDPWGHPFQFIPQEGFFELSSTGRDERSGTADDFTFRFRYH